MSGEIIALDLGTDCGWAVLTAEGARIASGTASFATRRGEGCGMRFVRAAAMFRALLTAYPGAVVVYEEVHRHAGTDAAHVYGGLLAELTRLCEEIGGHPYSGVPVATIKRCATGKGNAKKPAMCDAARAKWGVPVAVEGKPEAGDDEADALWCAEAWREGV